MFTYLFLNDKMNVEYMSEFENASKALAFRDDQFTGLRVFTEVQGS